MSMCHIANGSATSLDQIPVLSLAELRSLLLKEHAAGGRLAALVPHFNPDDGSLTLFAAMAIPDQAMIGFAMGRVDQSYPCLTRDMPAAHLFERELAETCGILPSGHPWLKPVRFHGAPATSHPDLPADFHCAAGPSVTNFFRMDGDAVHEVAVGPVHAGVIEPGHFRFQCHGEEVHHLEISLGYQHRGIEKALVGGPDASTIHRLERVAGDTSCGHATAYAMAVEALAGMHVDDTAQRIRAIGLELERIANHVGDLGALAGDVGFLPTASFCGRLRGDILNITASITGNRFGRGLAVPGGVLRDIPEEMGRSLLERLRAARRDIDGALRLLFATPSVLARFEGVGRVDAATAYALGLVGPAARASGLAMDARRDFPFGAYSGHRFEPVVGENGDVMDRAQVRAGEIDASFDAVEKWLEKENLSTCPDRSVPNLAPSALAVALVEGWRGVICHLAITGGDGRFSQYKIVDPSFHNWTGLAMALREQQISDFPLCNKSFNLSYCGFDL